MLQGSKIFMKPASKFQGIISLYTEILSRILNSVKVYSKLIKLYIQLFISLSIILIYVDFKRRLKRYVEFWGNVLRTVRVFALIR